MRNRQLFSAALLTIAVGWCGIATAQSRLPQFYLGGQFTYGELDSSRVPERAYGVTFRLGTTLTELLDLELVGRSLTFTRDREPNTEYEYTLGSDLLFVFDRGGFSPHLAIGGGTVFNSTIFGGDFTSGYLDAGFGFRVPLIENGLKLRFDARYYVNFAQEAAAEDDQFSGIRVSLGVELPLGNPAPTDLDGDGVPYTMDRCGNTPAGVPVGPHGCPLDPDGDGVAVGKDRCPGTPPGIKVGADGCPRDSDGDGVPDYQDQCPNTAAGVQVNPKGCPRVVDSDGDGVPDDQDLCPNTPPGARVLTNGCGVGQSAILQGVNFAFDSAQLTSTARDILRRVAQTLKDSPGFNVLIAGHTDSVGSEAYNMALSRRRAQSVRDFLVSLGVDPSRLSTRGYGESRPIATNETEAGRATNRRVELRVVE